MKRVSSAVVLLAAITVGAKGAQSADTVPTNATDFTNYMTGQLKQALTDYEVTIVSPLTIRIAKPGSNAGLTANLDRMHDFCASNQNGCTQMLQSFVAQAAATLKNVNLATVDPSMLRAVVRPKMYVEGLRKQIGDSRVAEMATEDLGGDLTIICYIDFPTAARPAMMADFDKLGISKEAALSKGKENVAAILGSLSTSVKELREREIGTLSGNYYESSLLALHDAWADTAERFNGELIVAVPAADKLLYAKRTDSRSVDALRTLAAQVARQSDRPLSQSVFHWTKDGWEQVSP